MDISLIMDAMKIAVPAGISLLLAALAFWRAQVTARKARRDQYVAETLVDAYLAFERSGNREYDKNPAYRAKEDEWSFELEDAVAKLQLLAPPKIAESLAASISPGQGFKVSPDFLTDIRAELRKQLGLKEVSAPPMSVRFRKNNESGNADP